MSYEIPDYTTWIRRLCERDYGVKEELDRILDEKEREREVRKKAFQALNRK